MGITLVDNNLFPEIDKVMSKYLMPHILFAEHLLYKKLEYVFYIFCIHFIYVFKKSTVFIRNWLIFYINYMLLTFSTLNQDHVTEDHADRRHVTKDTHVEEDHIDGRYVTYNSEDHVDGRHVTEDITAEDHGDRHHVTNITAAQQQLGDPRPAGELNTNRQDH